MAARRHAAASARSVSSAEPADASSRPYILTAVIVSK
jgi:hypothetical protein